MSDSRRRQTVVPIDDLPGFDDIEEAEPTESDEAEAIDDLQPEEPAR